MTAQAAQTQQAGLLGPAALWAGILLLAAAPVMRGGNRHVALIALELIALAVLLAIAWRAASHEDESPAANRRLVLFLAAAPALMAVVHLLPLPRGLWSSLAGRAPLAEASQAAGIAAPAWQTLSVSPDATAASLLAGLPIAAALLLGYFSTTPQLRLMLRLVVALAMAQVVLGLMQFAGGQHSPLYFGVMSYGPPVGTFANRNHFANYLCMALVALVWLGYESYRDGKSFKGVGSFSTRHRTALWAAGGAVLVLGVLMSRSRGGAVFGLPMAAIAVGIVSLRVHGRGRGWKFAVPLVLVLVIGAAILVGLDAATSRLAGDQLSASAGFRALLARTSFEGAMAFWPWGSGWGTYDLAYPRFQPANLPGFANHAHMDYVQMLFEGGMFFVAFAGVFAWLVLRRIRSLARRLRLEGALDREAMSSAICGLGLAALLLHSLVDFNMRIPANAILGALLAGAFLRPLNATRKLA